MNGSQSALAAGYSARNPKNAHIIAWTLLKREDVQARLKELRKATADEAIMSVVERKRRLSQIARARYDDSDRDGDPCRAIEVLNLMEGVYPRRKTGKASSANQVVSPVEVRGRIAEELKQVFPPRFTPSLGG